MLTAHEDLLEATRPEYKNLDNTSTTLINIGAKIGRLMETTQLAINPESEGGHKISESEKQNINKAINDVENKIFELKLLIDKESKLSEIK